MNENSATESQQFQSTGSQSSAPAQTSHESSHIPEGYVHQSSFDKVAGRLKSDAYEKGRRDALAESQNTQQSSYQPSQQYQQSYQQPQNMGMGGMQALDVEAIKKEAAQAAIQALQAQQGRDQGNQLANDFLAKVNSVSTKYDDFKDTVGQIDFVEIPTIAFLANTLPNCGDVIYELAKNPTKLTTLMNLQKVAPGRVQQELMSLSQSIQTNQAAAQVKSVNEPLDHIQPSPTSGADNGQLSVRDFKKRYRP